MIVETRERDLYEGVWSSMTDSYGDMSPGVRYLPIFLQVTGDTRGHVLDAGSGSGKAAVELDQAGFRVTMADFTDTGLVDEARRFPFHAACLWHSLKGIAPLGHFDWVFCCDVMEHLPTQFTMLAVEQMLKVSRSGLFLGICLHAEQFGYYAGASLHKTVESFTWWRDALKELGHVTDARDLLSTGVYVVEPRR